MSKYEPLKSYLENRRFNEVPMTFAEIEKVLGFKLPEKSQQHRAWWSNNASNSVMTKAWLAAGYRTERVDMAGRRLVFRRAKDVPNPSPPGGAHGSRSAEPASSGSGESSIMGAGRKRHPLFGAFADVIKIPPGVDLTEPADPTWGEQA
jgi:hypothetical protein